ncbi:MaoC family dehydratase [Mumia sp. DW29H23]|uniref:MaoC family dehydratase n=1 Tax=Mumia sp. DW29H23 TaxID=3421241 RepID=UPI003D68FDAB
MKVFDSTRSLLEASGQEVGVSDWVTVDQSRIDLFAEATGDHQWIHVDPERAASGPFGATVAHGYLTLALLVPLMAQTYHFENRRHALNYGLNKVRFPSPVPSGSRVRARVRIAEAQEVDGGAQVVWGVTVELEGSDRPACVAESITRVYF